MGAGRAGGGGGAAVADDSPEEDGGPDGAIGGGGDAGGLGAGTGPLLTLGGGVTCPADSVADAGGGVATAPLTLGGGLLACACSEGAWPADGATNGSTRSEDVGWDGAIGGASAVAEAGGVIAGGGITGAGVEEGSDAGGAAVPEPPVGAELAAATGPVTAGG